jgi:hypothetical protein
MTILHFGKHKNEMLEMQPESYIKWLASHRNVLSAEHRYISDAAKAILASREQAKAHAEAVEKFEADREARMAVKAAEQLVRAASKSYADDNLHNARGFSLLR